MMSENVAQQSDLPAEFQVTGVPPPYHVPLHFNNLVSKTSHELKWISPLPLTFYHPLFEFWPLYY